MIRDRRARKQWIFDTGSGERIVRLREYANEDEMGMSPEEVGQDPDYLAERQQGSDRLAGIPCTEWRLRLPEDLGDEAMTVCFASDGLPLRVTTRSSGMTTTQKAVSVEYGKLDPALFAPPPGWPVQTERQ
jgi:hypothetical protein